MQTDHLRPVPDEGNAGGPKAGKKRTPQRPRARNPLPTDRLKLGAQVEGLKAYAAASGYGKEAVGANEIAPYLGVAPATAGLNNAFFADSGLLVRESKGLYKPTQATNEFARRYGFDAKRAGRELAEPLRGTWYFQTVERRLSMGPVTTADVIDTLAQTAGATKDHQVQLMSMLSWLELAGLVRIESGEVSLVANGSTVEKSPAASSNGASGQPADPEGEGTTQEEHGPQDPPAETVLSFSFDFKLTKSDLEGLSPDQITALFEAVGKVVAIKATI